ncbi:TPA: hypothetical protein ACGO1T_001763 [Streptococcus suis]
MDAKIYDFNEIIQVITGPKNKGVYVYAKGADGAFFGFVNTGCYIKWENNLYLVDGSKLKSISNAVLKLYLEIKMMEKEKMNKKQWQQKIDKLEKELAELKDNPPKREPGELWEPEEGEAFWLIGSHGSLFHQVWNGCDFYPLKNFNVFETEKEAKFARERTKVMRELDTWAMDSVRKGNRKHYFYYDFDYDNFEILLNIGTVHAVHVFETKEIAEKAIEAIGEDRLKKYYFRVGD